MTSYFIDLFVYQCPFDQSVSYCFISLIAFEVSHYIRGFVIQMFCTSKSFLTKLLWTYQLEYRIMKPISELHRLAATFPFLFLYFHSGMNNCVQISCDNPRRGTASAWGHTDRISDELKKNWFFFVKTEDCCKRLAWETVYGSFVCLFVVIILL